MRPVPWRALGAELLGTALLLWAIVGSGIVVSGRTTLLAQLVPHALAVGLTLVVLIVVLGPVSGAHLNPAVTLAATLTRTLPRRDAVTYVLAQTVGGVFGVILANASASLPTTSIASRPRTGGVLLASEVGATLGLVLLILVLVRAGRSVPTIAASVGTYIAAAIVITPSTAFANPAVTVARMLSDTFTGIAPASVPAFVAAQLGGAVLAVVVVSRLVDRPGPGAGR